MTDCPICETVRTATPVYEDDLWHLTQFLAIPGFLILKTKRHTGDIATLTDEELATLAPTLARATAALKEASSAERVYFAAFLEHNPHFHVMASACPPDVPAEHRGRFYVVNFEKYDGQPEASAAIADKVRSLMSG